MGLILGYLQNGKCVQIAADSPNQHVALYGISGGGKSTRIESISLSALDTGSTVIGFDLNGLDFRVPSELLNRISAVEDGIGLRFLDSSAVEAGAESQTNCISYLTDIFENIFRLGSRQKGVIREAIQFGMANRMNYVSDMEAIEAGLVRQSTTIAQGVYERLWHILRCDIFRNGEKRFETGKINVVSFQGLNPSAQKELAELTLALLWKKIRMQELRSHKLTLIVDELQNYVLKEGSTLAEMLRESRKYGVNLILATQTLPNTSRGGGSYLVDQAAVQLYFRMSDAGVEKAAVRINKCNALHWASVLKNLQVGQSVAVGSLCVGSRKIDGPLVISTYSGEGMTGTKMMRKTYF